MAVKIAEYLGQRTDNDQLHIIPVHNIEFKKEADLPKYPFHGERCKKTSMKKYSKAPICAVRRTDGQYYIVCEHRLISTRKCELNHYRSEMLLRAAKALFHPHIENHQIFYKTEQRILVAQQPDENTYESDVYHSADFILAVSKEVSIEHGPRKLIVEIQGGGETSNTGDISRHADQWARDERGNAFLREKLSGPGTIQTNAWRRMQEQIFGKGFTAIKSGYGFAFLIGEVIMDYIERTMPGIKDCKLNPNQNDWNIAFVVFTENSDLSQVPIIPNSVELYVDTHRTIYTTIDLFVEAIKTRGINYPEPFAWAGFKSIQPDQKLL